MASNPTPVFTHHLTDLSLHSAIDPMGASRGGGITDNGYTWLQIAPEHAGDPMPVNAPVDMRLERDFYQPAPVPPRPGVGVRPGGRDGVPLDRARGLHVVG